MEKKSSFTPLWENNFFVVQKGNNLNCLLCQTKFSLFARKFNVERHFNNFHLQYKNMDSETKNNMISFLKIEFFSDVSSTTQRQPPIDLSPPVNSNALSSQKASYIVSLNIAKGQYSFTAGEFIKKNIIDVIKCFNAPEELVQDISTIPLSPTTVHRRINEIAKYLELKLHKELLECVFFSITLDESCDVLDTSQLTVFVRFVSSDFIIDEKLLKLISLHGHTKAVDILNPILTILSQLDSKKLSSICTDGARTMTGNKEGLMGLLIRNGYDVIWFHCIIHQLALCAKKMIIGDTMDTIMKIVNKIRGGHNALNHRKFKLFLNELDANYPDLTLFTEVRWLSKGKFVHVYINKYINSALI